MSSNFTFLQHEFQPMFATAHKAEQHALTDPMYAAILCRKSLEEFVKWLYDNDSDVTIPADTTLNSLLYEQTFRDIIPELLWRNINLVRKIGNNAAHGPGTTQKDAMVAVKIMHDFALWTVRLYSKTQTPVSVFDESLIPAGDIIERSKKQVEHLSKQFEETKQHLERANEELEHNRQLAEALRQKLEAVQQVKEAHKPLPLPASSVTEAETRRVYIDAMLKEAGWDITKPKHTEFEVTGMPHDGGIGYADYVLWGDDGKPLGVIEAKKTLVDARQGQRQAELYADCLEQMFGQRPVIFYTNGFETHIWDDVFYPPREVQGFYSKDEFQLLVNRRSIRKVLTQQSINKNIAGRYYQEEAIRRVAETLEQKRMGALLVMATGSGKTRTAAAITDLLTKANWAKRILFLADRNALVTQAKNAFNTYLPQLTAIDLTKEVEDTASRIVFSTYPTIMNRIDNVKTEGERFYGVGHFDVVVIDEAHRSIYMRYKSIFKYFDAIFIGLTATPKSDADKDTYEQFGLEVHNPTFAYELDRAVDDGYLVPPKGVKVPLKFPREGVKYNELSEAEKEAYEHDFLETFGVVPDEVNSGAINTWLFNEDTVNKVLTTLMDKGLKIQGGDRLGKTIIFAKNHDHALFIEKCFNDLYPHERGKMLRIIDNTVYNAQDVIYRFSDAANTEFQIAVSVDMLDTGIDIPEVLNLVLFKPVRSKAKFWQMIGRGTRLCKDIFGPGMDKEFFYVFDICGNIEFFNSNINETEPGIKGTLSEQVFKAKLNIAFLLDQTLDEQETILREQLLDELHVIVSTFNAGDFRVKIELRYVEKYKGRNEWNNLQLTDVYEIEKHLAHLYIDEGSDEAARRFDLLMLNTMRVDLEKLPRINYYQEKIRSTVKGLLKKLGIPQVKEQEPLIRSLLEDAYWKNANASIHNATRLALRNLIQYAETEERKNLYTDFKDMIGNIEEMEILGQYQQLGSYKKRVERFIRDNYDNITIHRIRNNKPITKSELEELEKLLFKIDEHGNKELLVKVTDGKPLGKFIRSILGLDTNAAKEAFSEFLNDKNLNAAQIHFINTIIDYLSVKGTIDKQRLFNNPFTEINDQGLLGVFDVEKGGKIISIVDRINNNAVEVG